MMKMVHKPMFFVTMLFLMLGLVMGGAVTTSQAQESQQSTANAPSLTVTTPATPPKFYTVVAGDTLEQIAMSFNVSKDALLAANPGLTPDKLAVGMVLVIPQQTISVPIATVTPTTVSVGGAAPLASPIAPATNTPLPPVVAFKESAAFTFADLEQPTFVMYFPDAATIDLNLPDTWSVIPSESYLEIHYDLSEQVRGTPAPDFASRLPWHSIYGIQRPAIDVYMEGMFVGSFIPEVGANHYVRLKLPIEMVRQRRDNLEASYRLELQYFRDMDLYCDYDGVLTVHDDSNINLTFNKTPPYLSLDNFPRPLVNDSFIPETLYIILPDDYSETDLSAAATIAAAIGAGTFSNTRLEVIKASQATVEKLDGLNAIIVGQPSRNSFLKQLYTKRLLPTTLSSNNAIFGVDPQDGVLQLIYSDLDPYAVYLAVSGGSDEAVMRAADALTRVPLGLGNTLAVIKASNEPLPVKEEHLVFQKTLAELGFVSRVVYGLQIERRVVEFYLPRNWEMQDGAALVLNYSYSTTLSLANSSISVFLNNVPVGTAPMMDRLPGEKQIVIPLKKEDLLTGTVNTLRFETVMSKVLDCALYEPRSTWTMIRDNSVLYLPYKEIEKADNLRPFVHPLYYVGYEPKTLISMPPQPSVVELNGMANLAMVLGSKKNLLPQFEMLVTLDPNANLEQYKDYNIVIIGKPTTNPQIGKINDELPQPFVPGEDALTLKQKVGDYRVQQDSNLGLIQVMPAPWNPYRGITLLTATTDEALAAVLDRAGSADIFWNVYGDLSFLAANQFRNFQSTLPMMQPVDVILTQVTGQQVILATVVPTSEAGVVATPEKYKPTTPTGTQKTPFLTYLIVVVVVIGLIIALIGISRTIRGGRKN